MTNLSRPAGLCLANWRTVPFSRWAFQHVGEIVPQAVIASTRQSEPAPIGLGPWAWIEADLVRSETDSIAVSRGGQLMAEWYAPHCDPGAPHVLFSVTKSVTGLLAGILVGRGQLDMSATVRDYVPECVGSAYADATVRQLFDMSVSIDFEEAYLDPDNDYGRYRRATLWNPLRPGDPEELLLDVLCRAPRASHPHGMVHAYRSVNTDMAGVVLERASGRRYHELVAELLWIPMGAHHDAAVTVDRAGTARAAGGLSATTRDAVRLGELVLRGGDGLVPSWWIEDMWSAGNHAVWAVGDQVTLFPDGRYRGYWYHSGHGELCAIGIHGQWIWLDSEHELVIVKTSSQAEPVNEPLDLELVEMFRAMARQ